MSKGRIRTIYEFDHMGRKGTVEFVKLDKPTPGWTHRVAIDGVLRDWLSADYRPSRKTALFFYAKYVSGVPVGPATVAKALSQEGEKS